MIKSSAVVGESCGRLWLPAAESSIHELRARAVTASLGGLMQTLQKIEDTWCRMLGHYYAKYDSTPRSRKLQGVVAWKASYTFLRNPNGNRYVLYFYRNGDKWNWDYNWLDNDWNARNLSVGLATLFISPSAICWGSFVYHGYSQELS